MPNTKLEKVFRDPVHNYIPVSNQIIYDLIGTTNFRDCAALSNSALPAIPSMVRNIAVLRTV